MTLKRLLTGKPGNFQEFIKMVEQDGHDEKVLIREAYGHEYDLGGQYHSTHRIDLVAKRRDCKRNIKLKALNFGYLDEHIEPSLKFQFRRAGWVNTTPISEIYQDKLRCAGFSVEIITTED